jgi:hypothetical protein
MATGIAEVFARSGFDVVLRARGLDKARMRVRDSMDVPSQPTLPRRTVRDLGYSITVKVCPSPADPQVSIIVPLNQPYAIADML